MNDSDLGVGLKARPDLTWKVKGGEYEPHLGWLLSSTLYQLSLKIPISFILNIYFWNIETSPIPLFLQSTLNRVTIGLSK